MKITKIREVKTPTRGTECSAGLDFYVPAGMKLSMLPGDDVLIPSGIKNYVKGHRKNGKPMYISESQQYKLAGNSIVVACMEHIFEQLFFPSGRVTEPRQLDIFDII